MAREVTIVDAGLGNLASVERALIQVGAAVRVSGDPDKVATSRMVVFPGQGAFGAATQAIVDGALGAALRMVIERGDPFLGICLGMQLLFDGSEENGGQPGLAILPGYCRRFPIGIDEDAEPGAAAPTIPIRAVEPQEGPSQRASMVESIAAALEGDTERTATATFAAADSEEIPREDLPGGALPQAVGASPARDAIIPAVPEIVVPEIPPAANAAWTPPVVAPVIVAPEPEPTPEPVSTEPLRRRVKVPHVGWNEVEPTGEHYYFVHSYYVDAGRSEDVMWVTSYGGIRFPAAVRYQNVLGCQFHPEKSQRSGLKFLRAFLLGGWG
jgi:imidazoleglycerol phosphate synthase glutamine amidotransferase subunit HisH